MKQKQPTDVLDLQERLQVSLFSASITAIVVAAVLLLVTHMTFWLIWSIGMSWIVASCILVYIGSNVNWTPRISMMVGALAPFIALYLFFKVYAPGSFVRIKRNTQA